VKIEIGGKVLVNRTKYEHYAKFFHPAMSEKNDNESAVLELQLSARGVSRVPGTRYSVFPDSPYLVDVVFAITEGNVSIEQFEKELRGKIEVDKFDYRYANLCEILAYCDIKTSWHKDTFLVPGTFYQDENLYRHAIRCSVLKMPMLDPKIVIEIKSWFPQTKIGNGRRIPLIRTGKERRK